jgi:hypothetical protein
MAVFIFLFLFFAFRIGLVRDLQDTISDQSWGRVQFAIGSAVTTMRHHGTGYTIAAPVKTVLESAGLTGDPEILKRAGLKFPENLRNPILINSAIKLASEAQWPFNPNSAITGNGGDDIGMVDFVRLSFLLFGFQLLSFYLTYFVVLGISLLLAVVAFRREAGVLAIFSLLTLALVLVFASSLLRPEIAGILDPRFLSTLAIVPGAHIAFAILGKMPWSRGNAVLLALQCLILVFGYWIRSSALWIVLGLLLLAAIQAIQIARRRQTSDLRSLWPVGLLATVVVAHLLLVSITLHPIYRSANERPYHGLWHAMLYALQFHPEWKVKYAEQYGNGTYDEHPEEVAKNYLLRNPPKDPKDVYLTEDRKYIRTDVSEEIKRKALFEFALSDPKFVAEAYIFSNGRLCAKSIGYHIASLKSIHLIFKFGILLILIVLAIQLRSSKAAMRSFFRANALLTCGFLVSLSYLIFTAPSLAVVGDQLLVFIALTLGWFVYGAASVAEFLFSDD